MSALVPTPDCDGFFTRPVPQITYSDGVVTIRPPRTDDLEADLGAKDDEQIHWMWLPSEREAWEAMSPAATTEHAAAWTADTT